MEVQQLKSWPNFQGVGYEESISIIKCDDNNNIDWMAYNKFNIILPFTYLELKYSAVILKFSRHFRVSNTF
jgi:hypothetical protein